MAVPKKPGTYKVRGGRYVRRLANGRVKFTKAPSRSASVSRRRSTPAKTAPQRRRKQPMKQLVNVQGLTAGAVTGAASALASNIPALGRFAPAVGLAVGGAFAGDASTKKTAHFLAGVALGQAVLPSSVGGGMSNGGLL